MHRVTNYTITKEPVEDQVNAGQINPTAIITFIDNKGQHGCKIAAGYFDEISVFQEYGLTLVLSHNMDEAYAGLEIFHGNRKINAVFLVGNEMFAAFGAADIEPSKMVSILKEWL